MLVCENLTVSYDGNVVLQDVSFEVSEGEYITVVGENGSGKTTLFKAILGEVTPASGSICINNKRGIGYLPQSISIDPLFPAKVIEIVLSGFAGKIALRPYYNAKEKKFADECLDRLGILDLKNRAFNELSGGQKQRVLLARALCATENFIMLDEPVASLDNNASIEFYEIIDRLHKEDGVTILMISHDPMAIKASDKVLCLSGHSVAMYSSKDYVKPIR